MRGAASREKLIGGRQDVHIHAEKKSLWCAKWYVIDAAEKPLGKTAVAAADLLRGKNDPTFTPMLIAVTSLSSSTRRRRC